MNLVSVKMFNNYVALTYFSLSKLMSNTAGNNQADLTVTFHSWSLIKFTEIHISADKRINSACKAKKKKSWETAR